MQSSPPPVQSGPDIARVKPKTLVQEYLLEHLEVYRELYELQRLGWQSEAGDVFFQNQRQQADNADARRKAGFFKLMRTIGFELDAATSALTIPSGSPAILDLCMAPGGFSSAALSQNPSAILRGISLPPEKGGHEMLLRARWSATDPQAEIYVAFRDITMLAGEMGASASDVPAYHPEAFAFDRPFLGQEFDLVFCDGQVLRTHERLEYREQFEATRLLTSQLVLGLQRIRPGGTMVILMHKADAWPSVLLMRDFVSFTDKVVLFKPTSGHKTRSSFYLVAKGVQPQHEAALQAMERWKAKWRMATFGLGSGDAFEGEVLSSGEEAGVRAVLDGFGPTLVAMAEPVFAVQAEALRKAPWVKEAMRKRDGSRQG